MGRRAKNKQGPPLPYGPGVQHEPSKKPGKRKAASDNTVSRPLKKLKERRGNISGISGDDRSSVDGWEDKEDLQIQKRSFFHDEEDEEISQDELEHYGEDDDNDDDDDEYIRNPVQEFDFESDVEEMPTKHMKSKSSNIMSTGNDESENGYLTSSEDGEPVTISNMEARSHAIDEKARQEAALDAEELRAAYADDEPDMALDGEDDDNTESFKFPTAEERSQEKNSGGSDIIVVQRRMRECVRRLSNFKKFAGDGRSRSDYVEQLIFDTASYYGYTEFLAEKLFQLFPVAEAIEFFEANEIPRPVTIRTNTLRTRRRDLAQALINRGVNLEPIGKWTNVGLQVFESNVPIGATPEYLAGHYMLQAASSFLPVIALSPQPEERVLDMASAPGGKTTHMAALMQNSGIIFANDANKARLKSLTANVHRLGCKNVIVCSYDGREFPKVMGGFDRVLLDAPCSGTGVISKDASVKINKTGRDFSLLSHLQKQLILCAIDSVSPDSKTGGYLVYSTCSVTVDENEAVVDYALRKRRNAKLVDTGLSFGQEGFTQYRGKMFSPSVRLTKRFYPHVHNMDGFYVAKFKIEKRLKSSQTNLHGAKDDVGNTVGEQEESAGFISDEDRPYIEESKRRHMKAKGLRPPPRVNTYSSTAFEAKA
ncbi:hypothetical protein APHAL10511_001254 [Amanita phalloides]|nr:hypothetical protein APHAL10511_001254 [Amanita phalloides]